MMTTLLAAVRPFTVVDDERLQSLAHLVSTRIAGVPGDVVECGVAEGGSAAVLGHAIRDTTRHLWLYDSCQGLPMPGPKDGEQALPYTGANQTSPERISDAMALSGMRAWTLVPGWFVETFATGPQPDHIAFLHIDADWFDSVVLCLRHWYPKLSPGGIVVLDDYGFWPGCRLAYDTFCQEQQLTPQLQRVGQEQAWFRK